jgi:hypothetical protein
VSVDQLAPEKPPSPELVRGTRAWKDDYPWLRRAFMEIGPGALAVSEGWRARIEDELKTTLDFKVRPDGTASVWCGMSGYDFRHDPAPRELFEGLREAYRRELKRVGGSLPARTGWKMSTGALTGRGPSARPASPDSPQPQPPDWALPPTATESLRILGGVLLPRVLQLTLIFLAVTAFTLVLCDVAKNVIH